MAQSKLSAKRRIEKEVLDEIINELSAGKLSIETAREIARETLATVAKIEEHEESIAQFYKRLSQKHPSFKLLYTKIKGEILRAREISAHRQALSAIEAGNIDEAHKIASSTIKATAHEATIIK